MSKKFLCVEHGERFIVEAKDHNEAREEGLGWGGEVIRELTPKEYASYNPIDGSYQIQELSGLIV